MTNIQICRFCKKGGIPLMKHAKKNKEEHYMCCRPCQNAIHTAWYNRSSKNKEKQRLYNKNYIGKKLTPHS